MRVLSIDGGGIRGIVPATVLAALEERAGQPVSALFDLIGGTSTGGILALALTAPDGDGAPRWTAAEVLDLYREEGPRIFSRSLRKRITSADGWLDERYDNAGLRDALRRYLGTASLGEALTRAFVTTYDLRGRGPLFFKSWHADDASVPMALAAEATSAAPTYFEPVVVGGAPLIDGGVFAGNPAMCAYAEARRIEPAADVVLLSLGTGVSQTEPISHDAASGWGKLEWAQPIVDVVFDGSSDAVDYQLDHILGERHHRLQAMTSGSLDDASPACIAQLEAAGRAVVEAHAETLDALAAELSA